MFEFHFTQLPVRLHSTQAPLTCVGAGYIATSLKTKLAFDTELFDYSDKPLSSSPAENHLNFFLPQTQCVTAL